MWRIRRLLRKVIGRDVLATDTASPTRRNKLRLLYLELDELLLKHIPELRRKIPRDAAMKRIHDMLELEFGYKFHEIDVKRPWGGYFRIADDQTKKFLDDFFPGESMGYNLAQKKKDIKLSPKIMIFMPGKQISWQYHHRRTERWHFLTDGYFYRSSEDTLPDPTQAHAGEIVQFNEHERHRGGAPAEHYTIVAEVWQHTEPNEPSDELDVVRLQDDFKRPKHPKRV